MEGPFKHHPMPRFSTPTLNQRGRSYELQITIIRGGNSFTLKGNHITTEIVKIGKVLTEGTALKAQACDSGLQARSRELRLMTSI